MSGFELFPAVDVMDGRAVQLEGAVLGTERFHGDPVEAALRWQRAGARWVHVADLDAAIVGLSKGQAKLTAAVKELQADQLATDAAIIQILADLDACKK